MANRIPLIVDPVAGQIQELPANDNLDLGDSSIVGVSTLTANSIVALNGSISGNVTISGSLQVSGPITGTLSSGSSGMLMSVIFGR